MSFFAYRVNQIDTKMYLCICMTSRFREYVRADSEKVEKFLEKSKQM